MSVLNRLQVLASFQKGIHHLAHNRTWTDDRHLNHDVVEAFRTIPWKRRHLRAAFDLKKSNGIGLLKSFVHLSVILRKLRQIHPVAVMLRDQFDAIFKHRHHSQSQQIDFHQIEISAIFLVPLHYYAPRHAGRLKRHYRAELPLADDHAAGMLAEMSRQVLHAQSKIEEFRNAWMSKIESCVTELLLHRVGWSFPFPRTNQCG